jgi:hypothetical protein
VSGISSRERMLAALRYEQSDYIPFYSNSFGFMPPAPYQWANQIQEAEVWLSLGVDPLLKISTPTVFDASVTVRHWEETLPGERWPLMVKEYNTPAGVIRQEVWKTDDWISEDWPGHKGEDNEGLNLIDDYNVVRSRKFAVETEADLARLKYLLAPLEGDGLKELREHAAELFKQAQRLGVAVEGEASRGVDMVTWMCGVDGMVMMAMDKPDLFEAVLDVIHAWDMRNTEMLLETPVDIVIRRGWYEGTAFWSPKIFKKFFLPRIRQLSDMVHSAGRLMGFKNSTGFMPMLDLYIQTGIDVHYFVDPIMGGTGVDLRKIKAAYDHKIAVIGGVSAAVTLERGTPEEIRQAVNDAIDQLGPNGLVLSPVDSLNASTPWASVQCMIEAWKTRTGAKVGH